ncbi:ATP-binding protein [Bradyrhizobium sp. Arg816]|uniref:ATP-binding protein n=1 Tax=Bradyrhizobium sp. Arg816 TaxID=2998491 RepID=UPI00249DB9E9|nr:ATP-binding protein [Bradyrhizobium sp. Arg816]MDI3560241.1 ATP-binding protein [Bradyrhizobium sp. Arg816]
MTLPTFVIKDAEPLVSEWPPEPYKGLNYYESEDTPLFAGRRDDLSICARLVGAPGTRLFVLHGSTGSGKSSFLRAALVPLLERSENGFLFIRDKDRDAPIFIRCTDDPFSRLAEAIHYLSTQSRTLANEADPDQPRVVDFSEILDVDANLSAFIRRIRAKELVELLARLASALPETLTVVIDQVEELFTLKPGKEGNAERERFFDFMHEYLRAEMDLKIILTLRTEYFGRLLARLRHTPFDATRVADYLLTDLNEQQLIEAIVRPTAAKPIDGFSAPPYRFRYERHLAERIARDLEEAVPTGGVLPVMQLACSRIYKTARERRGEGLITIKRGDYEGVEQPIEAYVKESLKDLCNDKNLDQERIDRETEKWRSVLLKLTKTQVDGTVTTELVPEQKLADEVAVAECEIPLDEATIKFLDERRIIRPVSVYNAASNRSINCFVLGHDVIGLALVKWEVLPPKVPLETVQRVGRILAGLSILGGVGYFLFDLTVSLVKGGRITYADVYGAALFYGLIGIVLSTRQGVRVATLILAAAAAAVAGVLGHLGQPRDAAKYERLATRLKLAVREDDDEEAKVPKAQGFDKALGDEKQLR